MQTQAAIALAALSENRKHMAALTAASDFAAQLNVFDDGQPEAAVANAPAAAGNQAFPAADAEEAAAVPAEAVAPAARAAPVPGAMACALEGCGNTRRLRRCHL